MRRYMLVGSLGLVAGLLLPPAAADSVGDGGLEASIAAEAVDEDVPPASPGTTVAPAGADGSVWEDFLDWLLGRHHSGRGLNGSAGGTGALERPTIIAVTIEPSVIDPPSYSEPQDPPSTVEVVDEPSGLGWALPLLALWAARARARRAH